MLFFIVFVAKVINIYVYLSVFLRNFLVECVIFSLKINKYIVVIYF